ncbi:CHD5 domain protein [Rhizoctonia solani]|uniref:CHD5 domain protein n=1 Tax=Rhizoctonia solani TaxID=456999 RepID=A0A8H8P474_9AGAM|nr:CHD5 domain protein [Rhizoctonia solani]QRW24037.1 CHD5 domain protein [Rhizoctonia solani]
MGTRGFLAYRHKGKYYRLYLHDDAHPSLPYVLPVDLFGLTKGGGAEWIDKITKALEDKEKRIRLLTGNPFPFKDEDNSDEETGRDEASKDRSILGDSDRSWTLGAAFIEWTYVFDFDDRVFTVNGAVNFRFDNMPPRKRRPHGFSLTDYLESFARVKIPEKHIKILKPWPPPRFDTIQAESQYRQLEPRTVPLSEWGCPSWDTLTTSQHLASSLVKTLVHDYSDELALAHYPSVWHKIGLFCWQVANAAAPSHLICPPLDATPKSSSLYVRADLVKHTGTTDPKVVQAHIGGKGTLGCYCWFRGCLVTFCPRLNEPVYMAHHVCQMVENLRKKGRTSGIGIIMSGWHVIAVAVDGPTVRQSPVLDLHDGDQLGEGVLMLMHLLSPTLTVAKTPWASESLDRQSVATFRLPHDVLQQIIHLTDWDTYVSLHFIVSRYFRSVYLAYPRVGDSILLGYESGTNSEPVFKVKTNGSPCSTLARLASPLEIQLQVFMNCVLRPGLAGTFQYLQSGTGLSDNTIAAKEKNFFGHGVPRALFKDVVGGDKYPEMRIQAVNGSGKWLE